MNKGCRCPWLRAEGRAWRAGKPHRRGKRHGRARCTDRRPAPADWAHKQACGTDRRRHLLATGLLWRGRVIQCAYGMGAEEQ